MASSSALASSVGSSAVLTGVMIALMLKRLTGPVFVVAGLGPPHIGDAQRGHGGARGRCGVIVQQMTAPPLSLLEFPADDPERAQSFWVGLLGLDLEARRDGEGEGWQTHSGGPEVGIHQRGAGPGDTFSLPYFAVGDIAATLERVKALGGSVIHPGEQWAICRDSEGTPFGVASRR